MLRFFAILSIFVVYVHSWTEPCPDVQTITPFDAIRYMGKWYELEKYPFIFESFQRCITAQYSLNPNGTVNVKNTGYIFDYPLSVNGIATPNPSNPSNLTVAFSGFGDGGRYWLLDTDYDNYALVYSCYKAPLIGIRFENAWILGRSKEHSSIPSTKIAELKQILSSKGSDTKQFTITDQDCTFPY